VGCGNNAHIYFYSSMATNTVELTIGQYTQQSSLSLWWHITDLI
jgi:hypothetical protein